MRFDIIGVIVVIIVSVVSVVSVSVSVVVWVVSGRSLGVLSNAECLRAQSKETENCHLIELHENLLNFCNLFLISVNVHNIYICIIQYY